MIGAREVITVRPRQVWVRLGRPARVMAVIERYVVYRFKGAAVSTMYWRDFENNFVLQLDQQGGQTTCQPN